MPTLLNVSGGDRNLPEFGLSVPAGESVEVDQTTADALAGHPDFDEVASPPPVPDPVPEPAPTTEEVTS